MKRFLLFSAIAIVLALGFIFYRNQLNNQAQEALVPKTSSPGIQPSPKNEVIDLTATFTIITDNITRSFQAEKYHNQSADVYVESSDPTIVHVTKKGITWDGFFQTLPMKLTKECLTTGDGETFCNEKQGTLKFFLNDVEDKDLLDKQIKQGDKALIKFSFF
jgi:hypothetical protein